MTLKTAIPGGNIASKLFDELSHSNFNNGEYNSSIDTLISTKDNSFMVAQLTWTRSSQTIEALNKSIDDKNLQIMQLMSKLDFCNSRESHHNLKTQEKLILILLPSQLTLKEKNSLLQLPL